MTSELAVYCTVSLLLLLSMAANVKSDDSGKLKYKVNKLETCPEYPNLPHNYKDLRIEMDPETETLYVSAILNATAPMEQGTEGTITIFQCMNPDEKSCEKYLSIEIEDFCAHMPEMNKTWTPIVSNLENFDPHCPIPPGIYELQDAPLETSNVEDKYAMTGHWQVLVEVKLKGEMFACFRGDATISMEKPEEGPRR